MPRLPKDPRASRRSPRKGTQTVVVPAAPAITAPPSPTSALEWSPAVASWWDLVWSSGVAAALWQPADAPLVSRLGDLLELAHRGEASAALLGEARQLEDRLGLSPMARRRLGVFTDGQPLAGELDDPDGLALVTEQRERWLRVVGG